MEFKFILSTTLVFEEQKQLVSQRIAKGVLGKAIMSEGIPGRIPSES